MQTILISLEELVRANHPYRQFIKVFDFTRIEKELKPLSNEGLVGADGYGIDILFRCLLLQFMENLSDRELERFLDENNSAKWFCGLELGQDVPTFTLFGKLRKRIGTDTLSKLFGIMRDQLKTKGYMSEVFTFVDASSLIAKASLWDERDKLIAQKIEKLNNETLPKVAVDPEAKIGCKGKDKYWYGFKRFNSVDMQSGMINKVTITPANVSDGKGFKHVCPRNSIIYGDKAFCTEPAQKILRSKSCQNATIKKNNMKNKNFDQDRIRTKWRMPFERVFSKQPKRARYKGIVKNQFAALMDAMIHNLKRLVVLENQPGALSLT